MKIGRHLVSFALGVAVGTCLYSLPKLQSLFQLPMSNVPPQVRANHPGGSLPAHLIQGSLLAQGAAPVGAPSEKHVHAVARKAAQRRSRPQPKPDTVKIAEPATMKEVAVVNVSSAPPAPTTFKPIGYVEKAGGQLEAIILQENEVQVVHIGDLISGRYRVTKIAADSVTALDETLVQSPMTKPNGAESRELTAGVAQEPSTPSAIVAQTQARVLAVAARSDRLANTQGREPVSAAPVVDAQAQPTPPSLAVGEDRNAPPHGAEPVANSLGYVQKADGKVETVVADGDTVRLVPETSTVTMAQTAPNQSQEGASPAQGSTTPAAAASAAREAMADSPVHPSGMSALLPASVIRQASYEVPIPASGAADGSASSRRDMSSAGEADETVNAASDPTASIFTENLSGSTDCPTQLPVLMKPLGFVVKGDGEFAAILSDDEEVYIVREGDRFAGRYRAVSVSADAVEAVEDPPRHAQPPPITAPPTSPDLLSASAQRGPPLLYPATFVFQTLGYAETQDGEMRAIVADGSQLYLVKQGETFADQYRATSVDPVVVLAVKVSPGQDAENFLFAQAESGGKSASKELYGYLHFPLAGLANAQALHEMGASGIMGSTDLGVNLLNSSLTGFDLQSHFFMADNPNVGF